MIDHFHNLFLEITTECNLKCQICDLWKRKDPINKLNIDDKLKFLKNIIGRVEEHNPDYKRKINVILTGGEPFLFPDEVLKISNILKEKQHDCYVNTNGSLLRPLTNKILDSGLTALTISIDSHYPNIHDNLRKSPGLFNSLILTIKLLLEERRKKKSSIKICIRSIIGEWNIRKLIEQIEFFEDLGIDGIQFQPFQLHFGRIISIDWFKESNFFPNSQNEIKNAIDDLVKFKGKNGFIMNSVEELKLFSHYFKNPEILPNRSCKAFEQNLIIDVCGNVKFCFNKSIEPVDKIGNILTKDLNELFNGTEATLVKESMRNCMSACGIMLCHIDSKLRE